MQAATVHVEGEERFDDAALFAGLYPSLRRFAAVAGPLEVDPDDLVQEAVERTLRHHRLNELDDAGAYLRRTILNLASNHRRGLARRRVALRRVGTADEGASPEYGSDLADLLRLPADTRALLYLVEVEGRPYAEAGALVGLTEEAARTRAARARRQLRAEIEGET